MCYPYTSTDVRPHTQSLLPHVTEKQFDEGVNFELRRKAFDNKSGLYPYIKFHFPLYLEKIEERVSEGGYHQNTNSNDTEGQILCKRHKDCETGCRNIHGDPKNPIENQTHESCSHELIPGVI